MIINHLQDEYRNTFLSGRTLGLRYPHPLATNSQDNIPCPRERTLVQISSCY